MKNPRSWVVTKDVCEHCVSLLAHSLEVRKLQSISTAHYPSGALGAHVSSSRSSAFIKVPIPEIRCCTF
jgi:hypothetical protein